MGCVTSKHSHERCRHCGRSPAPLWRTRSASGRRSSQRKRGNYHVVSLPSHRMDSLKLDTDHQYQNSIENYISDDKENNVRQIAESIKRDNFNSKEFATEITEAKGSSDLSNAKIPKVIPRTPTITPPGEPETINAWELMEGLEDASPVPLSNLVNGSFSFNAVELSKPKVQDYGTASPKPLWLQLSEDTDSNSNSIVPDFDPEIISTFRKALEELSPTNPFCLQPPEHENEDSPVQNRWLLVSSKDDVLDDANVQGEKQEKVKDGNIVISNDDTNVQGEKQEKVKDGNVVIANDDANVQGEKQEKVKDGNVVIANGCPPGGEDKVVIYFTSLRGVRKTYEDCCNVQVILMGYRVRVDERDVSMHYGFREELNELFGDGFKGGLPRVFVNGKYIGGADEIQQMHDDGQLRKVIGDCEVVNDGWSDEDGGGGGVCETCGNIRFVPCETCYGSCKLYFEGDECEFQSGFQRCPDCNENGIVRCPVCCSLY
uniref:Glutaredoxin domain-containing protein n=1 Tax=Nelumbo nucifera TaxID=4432 RepID=A0A822YFC8_NELNU|nr:TPA_asm: hypothetical protein HUJ06_010048 [Nelumbo nucifera]